MLEVTSKAMVIKLQLLLLVKFPNIGVTHTDTSSYKGLNTHVNIAIF